MYWTGVSTGILAAFLTAVLSVTAAAGPPTIFNLTCVNDQNFVTSVKLQQGGTCWTHGTMASIESALLMNGNWAAVGDTGEPNLAEYHLDWWNGYNDFNNDDADPPDSANGVELHYGGDYRMAAAYISRGEGPVRDIDGQSFYDMPPRDGPDFHKYYVRDIEWYTVGADLSNINTVKERLMEGGAVATCINSDATYFDDLTDVHYQPATVGSLPTHAVAIVGWNDFKETGAPEPGAWYVKNSWGTGWGTRGFFWVSYYDRWAGQHPLMGAVAFRNPELLSYDHIYFHDYHGWRRVRTGTPAVFNAFHAEGGDRLDAVSFYTMSDSVTYTVRVYDRFENGELLDEQSSRTGVIPYRGFHTIDLEQPVMLRNPDDAFYLYLELSDSAYAYDCTAAVDLLLGARGLPTVLSYAEPGQSYYLSGGDWHDFFEQNNTANFCVKGLSRDILSFDLSPVIGAVPLEVQCEGASPLDVESWSWSFSDGGVATDSAVTHTFVSRGAYDATLTVTVDGETYSLQKKECVYALCDTLAVSTGAAGAGEEVEVTISGSNVIPLRVITIPIEYSGDVPLAVDSVSIAGCRTADFASVAAVHSDLANRRFTVRLLKSMSDPVDCLCEGVGPLLKVYFRIGAGAVDGDSAEISIDGYGTYLPTLVGPLASYCAVAANGAVGVEYCCENKGNVDGVIDGNTPVNVADLSYLVAYIFQGGPAPACLQEADLNSQAGEIDVGDLALLVGYLFQGMSLPLSCP